MIRMLLAARNPTKDRKRYHIVTTTAPRSSKYQQEVYLAEPPDTKPGYELKKQVKCRHVEEKGEKKGYQISSTAFPLLFLFPFPYWSSRGHSSPLPPSPLPIPQENSLAIFNQELHGLILRLTFTQFPRQTLWPHDRRREHDCHVQTCHQV